METEVEKSETSSFERFFYWFLMPAVFVAILAMVYLYVFDQPFKEKIQSAAGSLPLVGGWFKPADPEEAGLVTEPDEDQPPQDQMSELQHELIDKDARLLEMEEAMSEKEALIADLEEQLSLLSQQIEEETYDDEAYRQQIKQTSSLYGKMMPSKAAAIMESLTQSERVLFLSEMKQEERTKILEKMTPAVAAEATVGLKDQVSARDVQLAALQERVREAEASSPAAAGKLSNEEIGATFASMVPKQAAVILLAMHSTHPQKVLDILNSTGSESRSRIVSAMSEEDSKQAAAIVASLVP